MRSAPSRNPCDHEEQWLTLHHALCGGARTSDRLGVPSAFLTKGIFNSQ